MNGYSFNLSCPNCGGELRHIASGSRRPWQQAAMARCKGPCRRDLLVCVEISYASEEKGAAQHHRIMAGHKARIEAEHDEAMERSARELADA